MLNVAMPEALMAEDPSRVAPSLNCTVPEAVLAPEIFGVTVAVKVTFCPDVAGFADEVSPVAVVTSEAVTVWLTALEVLVVKLASPA